MKPLAPCGTPAAYARHIRHSEPIDDACRAARTAEKRNQQYHRAGSPRPDHSVYTPTTKEEGVLARKAAGTVLANAASADDARLLLDAIFGWGTPDGAL